MNLKRQDKIRRKSHKTPTVTLSLQGESGLPFPDFDVASWHVGFSHQLNFKLNLTMVTGKMGFYGQVGTA